MSESEQENEVCNHVMSHDAVSHVMSHDAVSHVMSHDAVSHVMSYDAISWVIRKHQSMDSGTSSTGCHGWMTGYGGSWAFHRTV